MVVGLDVNTVRRRCGRAKQFFRAAVRKKLIAESPFGDMKDCKVSGNDDRFYFVTRDEADKVLAACPDPQTQLLFALCRYGGLRCPSEHTWLRWDEAKADRFTVHSPKTEHCDGHESREVPMFAELRPYFDAAKAAAPKGAEYVINLPSVARFRRGSKSPNLGTRMTKIIKRAGLTPWPKLFQNLRATRQTELESQRFPSHVVCQWLGNSEAVARKHYLRVTDADFVKAAGVAEPKSEPSRNLIQHPHTTPQDATLGHVIQQVLEAKGFGEIFPAISEVLQNYSVTPRGLEPLLPP